MIVVLQINQDGRIALGTTKLDENLGIVATKWVIRVMWPYTCRMFGGMRRGEGGLEIDVASRAGAGSAPTRSPKPYTYITESGSTSPNDVAHISSPSVCIIRWVYKNMCRCLIGMIYF